MDLQHNPPVEEILPEETPEIGVIFMFKLE
jgi:hypothetical protein